MNPREQSDLGPYCLQYRLPKELKQRQQTIKIVTGEKRVKVYSSIICKLFTNANLV